MAEHESEAAHALAEQLNVPVMDVTWEKALAELRASDQYQSSDHSATTLAKHDGLRVVLIGIKAGGQLPSHATGSPISVQCLTGRIRFTVEDDAHELTPGHVLVVAAGLRHGVNGVEESALLLTIGGTQHH